jgi:hypothetical protein
MSHWSSVGTAVGTIKQGGPYVAEFGLFGAPLRGATALRAALPHLVGQVELLAPAPVSWICQPAA